MKKDPLDPEFVQYESKQKAGQVYVTEIARVVSETRRAVKGKVDSYPDVAIIVAPLEQAEAFQRWIDQLPKTPSTVYKTEIQ
jgi:hypothetical protein